MRLAVKPVNQDVGTMNQALRAETVHTSSMTARRGRCDLFACRQIAAGSLHRLVVASEKSIRQRYLEFTGIRLLSSTHGASDAEVLVYRQHMHCYPASWRQAVKHAVTPCEMICPTIATRIEERHNLPGGGVETGNVRALVPIACVTSESEIIFSGFAGMLNGNNVIDLKLEGIKSLASRQYSHELCAIPDELL